MFIYTELGTFTLDLRYILELSLIQKGLDLYVFVCYVTTIVSTAHNIMCKILNKITLSSYCVKTGILSEYCSYFSN